jgi:hypothetical protein
VEIRMQRPVHSAGGEMRGSIFSFVAANGGSRAGTVSQQLSGALSEALRSDGVEATVLLADFETRSPSLWRAREPRRRLDGKTWGAFVSGHDGVDVLEARDVHPRQLPQVLDYAREKYPVVCADLAGAKEAHALAVLRASEGIFLVANSNRASLAGVREKGAWLRSIDLGDRCGVLLERVRDGAEASEVEDLTGLPVSSLIENQKQIGQFACWLAANYDVGSRAAARSACAS